MKKLLPNNFLLLGLLLNIIMGSCNSKTENQDVSNFSGSGNSSQQTNESSNGIVDVDNVLSCQNYLRGKVFYGGSVRLDFLYDGNVGVYNNETNELVFTGYSEVLEKYGSASRRIKIKATSGNEAVRLTLGNDGKLMDETDFTIYKTGI